MARPKRKIEITVCSHDINLNEVLGCHHLLTNSVPARNLKHAFNKTKRLKRKGIDTWIEYSVLRRWRKGAGGKERARYLKKVYGEIGVVPDYYENWGR